MARLRQVTECGSPTIHTGQLRLILTSQDAMAGWLFTSSFRITQRNILLFTCSSLFKGKAFCSYSNNIHMRLNKQRNNTAEERSVCVWGHVVQEETIEGRQKEEA